jgi:hypothetical protein
MHINIYGNWRLFMVIRVKKTGAPELRMLL